MSGMIVRDCCGKNKRLLTGGHEKGGQRHEKAEKMPGLPAKNSRQQTGQAGEDAALAYLLARGLALVDRNFRCRAGEIDLIMRDGDALVFIEVRKRSRRDFGGAVASITYAKQRRLVKTAQIFLQQFTRMPASRFDAVALDNGKITWLKNIIDEA